MRGWPIRRRSGLPIADESELYVWWDAMGLPLPRELSTGERATLVRLARKRFYDVTPIGLMRELTSYLTDHGWNRPFAIVRARELVNEMCAAYHACTFVP